MFRIAGRGLASAGLVATSLLLAGGAVTAQQTVTMWSHWPDEVAKRTFVEGVVKEFEAADASCKVKLNFIQKSDLYTQAKTAVRTGTAPDIFWLEPDEIGFAQQGYLEPLDTHLDMAQIEDWAKPAWTHNGKFYGLPIEAYTIEMYYNRDLLKKIGIDVPANHQLSQDAFMDMIKKSVAAGITPISQGIGDRPYPGAIMMQEALLRRLGAEAYEQLLTGKLSYKDPRVLDVLKWTKSLSDAGAYPKSFSTLKLGEAHYYFHTNPGALTFPIGSWYTGRAFVPIDKGGQPKDFPLGIMQFPAMKDGVCNNCKTLAVGGSYVMFSKSPNKACAGKLLKAMSTLENGNKWMEGVLLQTGIKTDPSRIKSIYAPYFKELQERNASVKYFIGTPLHFLSGKCGEAFKQVLNAALPSGQITPDDAASKMDSACLVKS